MSTITTQELKKTIFPLMQTHGLQSKDYNIEAMAKAFTAPPATLTDKSREDFIQLCEQYRTNGGGGGRRVTDGGAVDVRDNHGGGGGAVVIRDNHVGGRGDGGGRGGGRGRGTRDTRGGEVAIRSIEIPEAISSSPDVMLRSVLNAAKTSINKEFGKLSRNASHQEMVLAILECSSMFVSTTGGKFALNYRELCGKFQYLLDIVRNSFIDHHTSRVITRLQKHLGPFLFAINAVENVENSIEVQEFQLEISLTAKDDPAIGVKISIPIIDGAGKVSITKINGERITRGFKKTVEKVMKIELDNSDDEDDDEDEAEDACPYEINKLMRLGGMEVCSVLDKRTKTVNLAVSICTEDIAGAYRVGSDALEKSVEAIRQTMFGRITNYGTDCSDPFNLEKIKLTTKFIELLRSAFLYIDNKNGRRASSRLQVHMDDDIHGYEVTNNDLRFTWTLDKEKSQQLIFSMGSIMVVVQGFLVLVTKSGSITIFRGQTIKEDDGAITLVRNCQKEVKPTAVKCERCTYKGGLYMDLGSKRCLKCRGKSHALVVNEEESDDFDF